MRVYIVTTFIGCFALNEKNEIILFRPFPKNPEKIAKKLQLVELIEEEKEIIDKLKEKGYKEFVFSRAKKGFLSEPKNKAEEYVRQNLSKLAIKYKFVENLVEFNKILTQINIELTKMKIKKAISRDKLIVQTIRAIEEIEKSINIFVERIREWYSLYFPEMDRAVKSHERFISLVASFGLKEKIKDPELSLLAEKSMGVDLKTEDIKIIRFFAQKASELYKLKNDLTKYLEKIVKEVAPNFSELATPILAAKLISKAGSLEKIAKMSSSTIQLIGAEKALFRYLRGKGKPPKYGLIYNHPLIQKSPLKKRGKVARVLASKLSMAAKIDYFSGKYKADQLKKELEERIKEILSSD